MVCEPTMKLIALMDVQPDGAGYVARDGFNLVASTDEWMSPVFAEVGPDGAVWFADWQNFIVQHNPTPTIERAGYQATTGVGGAHENPLRDHSRGRIYRVVWAKAERTTGIPAREAAGAGRNARVTARPGAGGGTPGTADLVKGLGGATQCGRLTAQRLLVEGKRTDAVDSLKKLVASGVSDRGAGSIAALHALWTLHGLGALDEATHQSALAARDPALRRNAIRALGSDERSRGFSLGPAPWPTPTRTRASPLSSSWRSFPRPKSCKRWSLPWPATVRSAATNG